MHAAGIYCKTLYISVPLMLAKLAMRYHSLTLNFVVAKSNVYYCACAVVCHAVTRSGKWRSPVYSWVQKGKQSPLLLRSCHDPCISTSAENRSVEQVRAKERRKCGKYKHYDAEVRVKMAKHACAYGNKSAFVKFTQELGHCVSESSVRNEAFKSVPDPADIISFPHAALGRPLLVGSELDADIAIALKLMGANWSCTVKR